MTDVYTYNAKVVTVHDGDTVTLNVDMGFSLNFTDHFRLYGPDPDVAMGLNAPELNTQAGKTAQKFLESLLAQCGNQVVVRTIRDKKEKYGRYMGVLFVQGPVGLINVNQALLDSGNAKLEKY
jgi:micrococcal nuclease